MAEYYTTEPVVVVGTGCRFPGGIDSQSKLWEMICSQRDLLLPIPESRFNAKGFYHPNGERHGSTNVARAYLLQEDIRAFDAAFFGINSREAEAIDPQHRMLLETVYEAMEDAGLTIDSMKGSNTAVYVGLMTDDYHQVQVRDPDNMATYTATGTARSILSNRVSYFFDWNGPSMTIDTACSSSLVALHLAVQALRSGECRIAVAAGANLILGPEMMIAEANLHMLSPTGRSRMWDAAADGYARGEGIAAVMLKTLSQAIADGDQIDYIIRETGVNQDGRTRGITMPSSASQTALIRETYRRAGLDCTRSEDRCQFFEAHGTGTPRGDPIEAQAISHAFFPSEHLPEKRSPGKLYVGSVKSVIGHLEGCAGLAGLLKAGAAVHRGQIPPNMHFSQLHPEIAPMSHNMAVPTTTLPWPATADGVRRASVNSFGFGGTNAHAIIESYCRRHRSTDEPELPAPVPRTCLPLPFTFTASSKTSLVKIIARLVERLQSDDAPAFHLNDIAVALTTQRSDLPIRAAFSAASSQDLIERLKQAADVAWSDHTKEKVAATPNGKTLGIFTGQGAQWAGMGRELIQSSPLARRVLQRMQQALDSLPDGPSWSIEDELVNSKDPARMEQAAFSQPLCTAVQVMLVDLLRTAGISFDCVVGHSSGEMGAAYAAGLISADSAIRIAFYRGLYAKLAGSATGTAGAMMAVALSLEEATTFLLEHGLEGRGGIAAVNAPESVTLSGDRDAMAQAKAALDSRSAFGRMLKVDTAYHSSHMHPCLDPFCSALRRCGIAPLPVDEGRRHCAWISTVHGRLMTTEEERQSLKETYWRDNLAQPVLFSQAIQTAHTLYGPFDIALEVGPHPALKNPVLQTIKAEGTHNRSLAYSGTLRRFGHDVEQMSMALACVWEKLGGHKPDFVRYSQCAFGLSPIKLPRGYLPHYAWDHSHCFWSESIRSRNYRLRQRNRHDLLGARCPDDHSQDMRWRNQIRVAETLWLSGHKVQGQIVLPAAAYLVMALQAAKEWDSASNDQAAMVELRNVEISRAIALPEEGGVEVMFQLRPTKAGASGRVGEFLCYSATNTDEHGTTTWQLNVCGELEVFRSEQLGADFLPLNTRQMPPSLVPVRTEQFYSALDKVGLEYTGLFRGLDCIRRRHGYAVGNANSIPRDPEMPVMIHPALLDACFQTIFAAFCWPGDGSLHSPYVPTSLQSLRVFVPERSNTGNPELPMVQVDSTITESNARTVTADLTIYPSSPSGAHVQLEGLTCTLLGQMTDAEDCELFTETVWNADVDSGLDDLQLAADSADDLELVDLCERLAYFYLRQLNAAVRREHVQTFAWNHQRIFEFIDHVFQLIQTGQHPTVRREWADDSLTWLLSEAAKHPGQADLDLIVAVGKNLSAVVYGKTTMLEHMVADNLLDRFYESGLGFQRANGALSRTARQIAHRYPAMNILEIGAGTGGATKAILEQLGGTFATYTFTDISAGFFDKAQAKFQKWSSKMAYMTLDIESDPATQGFADAAFDLVIASNVLHATRSLEFTMRNVRQLLKPGGYLLLLEVTSDILRVRLMMSGLPGWWLGDADGRRFAPTISATQWDSLLLKTGFAGIQQRVTDFEDTSKHMTSVMLSQATDPVISLLKHPLGAQQHPTVTRIAVIGGVSAEVKALADEVASLLAPWSALSVLRLTGFEDIGIQARLGITSLVSLSDLDEPLLMHVHQAKLSGIQAVLEVCQQVLWVTSGCREQNPYANMTVGLGRSLVSEYPHIRMQFMDVTGDSLRKSAHIAGALGRLIVADKHDLPSEDLLWTSEPEVVLEGDQTMIPRILPIEALNTRLNARRRHITQQTCAEACSVVVSCEDGAISLLKEERPAVPTPGMVSVRARHSLLHSVYLAAMARSFYIVHGVVEHAGSSHLRPGESVLVLADYNASHLQVCPERAVSIDEQEPLSLLLVVFALMAIDIVSTVRPRGSIVLIDPALALQTFVETMAAKADISVKTVSISPFLTRRQLAAMLPPTIDLVVIGCSPQPLSPSLEAFLSQYPTLTLADMLSLKPGLSSKLQSFSVNRVSDCERYLIEARNTTLCEFPVAQSGVDLISLTDLPSQPLNSVANRPFLVIDFAVSPVPTVVKPIQPRELFRADGSYLLVGCTGGLGQSLTRWMVQNGARHLALTTRHADKLDIAWLSELRKTGADIVLHELDVADKAKLVAMHSQLSASFPPVVGVVNAAMVLDDRLFRDMTVEALTSVLKPKVSGTANLDEIFSAPTLDFFVLFSSLASIKGIYESTLRKFNYMPISEPVFHVMLAEAIAAGRPESPAQAEMVTGLHRIVASGGQPAFWSGNPRFSHHIKQDELEQGQANDGLAVVVPVRRQLVGVMAFEQASEIILNGFLCKLERVLQVSAANIDPAQTLIDLGVDSLMATEIQSWFRKETNTPFQLFRLLGDTDGPPGDRLSFAQERLWFLRLFLDDPSAYNVTMMYQLNGPNTLDMCNAMNLVLARHQSLRTAFVADDKTGVPHQYVLSRPPTTSVKLRSDEDENCHCAARREFDRLRCHRYDLEHGETVAASLFSRAETAHILVLGFHHIVFDGFSAQVFVKDLVAAITAAQGRQGRQGTGVEEIPSRPRLPLEYRYIEFARRQRQFVQSSAMDAHIGFWNAQFAELPAPLPLFDFCLVKSRKPLTVYQMCGAQQTVPSSTTAAFKQRIRRLKATPFYGHLAVLQILLYGFLNVSDLCIGTTDSNRTEAEFLDTIGFFVNLLPLRFVVDGASSFEDLLSTTFSVASKAIEHSCVPFDVLLDSLGIARSPAQSPLFQVLLNYRMGSTSKITMPSLQAELMEFEDASNPYDLVFDVEEKADGTTVLGLLSQSYLYSQTDLAMVLGAYVCVLESCSSEKGEGCAVDQHQLCRREDAMASTALAKGPRLDFDDNTTLPCRIAAIAATHGTDVAIKDSEGCSLSYEGMMGRVQHIASTLQANGIGSGHLVAVYCEPSANSVCYLLAIWCLNAVYVPLDPQNPAERLQLILDDCQPAAIIYDQDTQANAGSLVLGDTKSLTFAGFPAFSSGTVPSKAQSVSPACVLFTSGSTGRPKGITLTHANVLNQVMGVKTALGLGKEAVLLQSSLGFDISIDQMMQPLTAGGTLVIASRRLRADALELTRLMLAERITYTYATPSEYAFWLRYGSDNLADLTCWKTAVVGGEELPAHLIHRFQHLGLPGQRLINRYGPTEITISSSAIVFDLSDPGLADSPAISVGTTLPNYSTYILAPDGSPVPVGYVGEIVVGGSGVALGYLGRDGLTRQRFVPDPFASRADLDRGWTTMYHTGDRGRLLPSGELFFFGRIDGDSQIKLRGVRIELDEIANAILRKADGLLAGAVVSVRGSQDEDGDRRYLVAWIIPSSGTSEDVQQLISVLAARLPLPAYMMPSVYVPVDDFPRSANGKLDRRQLDLLELPQNNEQASESDLCAEELAMVDIWKTCLDQSALPSTWTRSTDFFQHGGNSLLMVRLKAVIRERLGVDLALPLLFQASTVERMAQCVSEKTAKSEWKIDWAAETRPGEEESEAAAAGACLKGSTSARDSTKDGLEVCLTGATGFLGTAILQQLVASPQVSHIHCLAIRPLHKEAAAPRELAVKSAKIIQYAGDLTAPRLGLDPRTWHAVGQMVDAIIHNGADVSFLKSYPSLRAANLQSTRQLACLALRRSLPLHFVSTGGVAQLVGANALPPMSVSEFPPPADGSMGYVASKWAAETYLEACASRYKLRCTIHRPSSIVGEDVPATDLVQTIVKISVDRGVVPSTDDWTGAFDFVPVTDVATGICNQLQAAAPSDGAILILHHCGDEKIPVGELKAFLERQQGCQLCTVDVDAWMEEARQANLPEALYSLIGATLRSNSGQAMPLSEDADEDVETGWDEHA
ncbi:hypothetical protein DV735_g784, partial [Chaetothyriales sp. CBS 134920]